MPGGEPVPGCGEGAASLHHAFVTDAVTGIRAAMGYRGSCHEILNLGHHGTVRPDAMIDAPECALGGMAVRLRLSEQSVAVPRTRASLGKARRLLAREPKTGLKNGVRALADGVQAEGVAL